MQVSNHYVVVKKALVILLTPTLSDSIDCSPPGSFVQGILQARILEWVAISMSNRLGKETLYSEILLEEGGRGGRVKGERDQGKRKL